MRRFTFENGKIKSELLKKYDVRSEEDMQSIKNLKLEANDIVEKIPLKQKVITLVVICVILSLMLLLSEFLK
jgi:hypothetical protein